MLILSPLLGTNENAGVWSNAAHLWAPREGTGEVAQF